MKAMQALLLLAAVVAPARAVHTQDKTITQVVKLLQHMLEKSKEDGENDRKLYAKFKCYCDTSEADKTASIKTQTELIDLLESKIAELQGDTGGLSSECADLKAAMADFALAPSWQQESERFRQSVPRTVEAVKACTKDQILLDIGGVRFRTTLATLRRDENSLPQMPC